MSGSFESVKDLGLDGGGVKEPSLKKPGMATCPYCGSRFEVRPSGGLVFCGVCHRRMPWIVIGDVPVKEFGS